MVGKEGSDPASYWVGFGSFSGVKLLKTSGGPSFGGITLPETNNIAHENPHLSWFSYH